MKTPTFVIAALALLPVAAAAQVELGLDAALAISNPSGSSVDNTTSISLPSSSLRAGFHATESFLVEPLVSFQRSSTGDLATSALALLPGVNYMIPGSGRGRFYVRGEGGVVWIDSDISPTQSSSATQWGLGGAFGVRVPAGGGAMFRTEVGVDRWFENEDDLLPSSWDMRIGVGVSAIIN